MGNFRAILGRFKGHLLDSACEAIARTQREREILPARAMPSGLGRAATETGNRCVNLSPAAWWLYSHGLLSLRRSLASPPPSSEGKLGREESLGKQSVKALASLGASPGASLGPLGLPPGSGVASPALVSSPVGPSSPPVKKTICRFGTASSSVSRLRARLEPCPGGLGDGGLGFRAGATGPLSLPSGAASASLRSVPDTVTMPIDTMLTSRSSTVTGTDSSGR